MGGVEAKKVRREKQVHSFLVQILLCGIDGCYQKPSDGSALMIQWQHDLPVYQFRADEQLHPILRLIAFLQCNLQLGSGMFFQSLGKNQVEARLATAKKAYHYLKNNNLLLSLTDEVGELVPEKAINQLQELYQKGFIGEPGYAFAEFSDADGNPVWECTCSVKGLDRAYSATHTSKQRAKKRAAYLMAWLYLGNMGDEHRDEA